MDIKVKLMRYWIYTSGRGRVTHVAEVGLWYGGDIEPSQVTRGSVG